MSDSVVCCDTTIVEPREHGNVDFLQGKPTYAIGTLRPRRTTPVDHDWNGVAVIAKSRRGRDLAEPILK